MSVGLTGPFSHCKPRQALMMREAALLTFLGPSALDRIEEEAHKAAAALGMKVLVERIPEEGQVRFNFTGYAHERHEGQMEDPKFFDSLSQREKQYLWALLETGLYGETIEEVMRQLIRQGLQRAVEKRLIPKHYE